MKTPVMMAAIILVAAACKGGGDSGWMKANRTEATGLASGVSFTLQVPEGFKKAGDDKYPRWQNEGDTVSFGVSSTDKASSLEAAIAKISLPDDQYHVEKKEGLPDGFLIRRLSEPEKPGVVFVDVFKSGSTGNLHCHASAMAGGRTFDDLSGTLAALEEVCRSLKLP